MEYNRVAAAIQPPENKEHLVKSYQDTHDIIQDLIYCFKNYNYQAQPVVKLFATNNTLQDGKNIYDFIKNNIEYEAEPEKDQTTRSFSRIIYDKWGDCKHNALLASSLAWNMGYNVIFKFVSYDGNNYGHVYTILENPKTLERVIIDPLQKFNYEKPYKKATNRKAEQFKNKTMLSRLTGTDTQLDVVDGVRTPYKNKIMKCPVYHELQGIGEVMDVEGVGEVRMISESDLQGIGKGKLKAKVQKAKANIKKDVQKVKASTKKAATAVKKAGGKTKVAIKKAGAKAKAGVKARGGIVKTVALLPVRAAGSVLFMANFRGFATRFRKLPVADQQAFAKKFGYKYDTLKKEVAKGASKKPVFGSKANGIAGDYDVAMVEGIGAISLAAAATAAAPLILALTQLFKSKKLDDPSDIAAATEAAASIVKDTLNERGSGGSDGRTPAEKVQDAQEAADKIVDAVEKNREERNKGNEGEDFVDKVKDSVKNNPIWWFGAAAVVVYVGGKKLKVF